MTDTTSLFGKKSYEYAVGRVRAREFSLLSAEKWAQLEAADEQQAKKLLWESGYGGKAGADIEELTDRELRETADFIHEISPDPTVTDLFFMEQDAHNLKVILKARQVSENPDPLLLEGGVFPVELLKVCVEHESFSPLGAPFEEALEGIFAVTDPQLLSARVDNAVYQKINDTLTHCRNPFVVRYFTLFALWKNRIGELRAERLGWTKESLRPLLLPLPENHPEVKAPDSSSPEELERQLDPALFALFEEKKDDSAGIAPILCFLLKKRQEAKRLRILFVQKRAGISGAIEEESA